MNTAARGGLGFGRQSMVLFAVICIIPSGCLIISWDSSGKKTVSEGTSICRSNAVETFDADAATVRLACRHALKGLDMPAANDTQEGNSGKIEVAKGDKEKITIAIKQQEIQAAASAPRTVVTIQMTSSGDGHESRQIMEQVEAYLAGVAAASASQSSPGIVQASEKQP